MGEFSILWALLIFFSTILLYAIIRKIIPNRKDQIVLLCTLIAICIYSGLGIAYSTINKKYFAEYFIYILILSISFAFFASFYFGKIDDRYCLVIGARQDNVKDEYFWSSDFASKVFITFLILYFVFRFGSLIYPVNKLSSLSIVYNAVNNLRNISGQNANILNSIADYIKPLAYIGMFYAFRKVRYVAVLLGLDLFITLIYSGYLSRSYIICAVIIVLFLYFNNDLSDAYISLDKKRKRVVITLAIVIPIVLYIMLYLMTIRTTGQSHWTVGDFFSSEIDYPKYYDRIEEMSGQLMTPKDMLLHILDSFVPFIPTPGYTSNLNVLFSERISGIKMDVSYFSVTLPSVLGESVLLFGKNFFWVHAIIIAFMMSMITKIVGNNHRMIILYYYYITCAMKVARAGYEEISSTVMFNIIILWLFLTFFKLLYNTIANRRELNQQRDYFE